MRITISLGILLTLLSCGEELRLGSSAHIEQVTKEIDDEVLINAENRPEDWLMYGRTYNEDRQSPLKEINTGNVKDLGLAWITELGTRRGIEATPLVVNGIMFLSSTWSKVHAIDTRKGTIIWTFDPQVPKYYGEKVCCDVINRGLALYKGMIIFGTLDGRLIALNASDGTKVWETLTVDQDKHYSITGAPRIVKGNVIIGNGGAEFGVRGYITAYDAMTGELNWRFYTVPGDPSEPLESDALKMAVKTWSGKWWEYGGGGTVWDAIVYDPELDMLYIGTGNGSPWNRIHRSNDEGDNLFLSSILALKPDSGELIWYYQTTPGDNWDYTATQPLVLSDLEIDGQSRKVIMQAPKNGFFYVLDRTDGELLSAEPYTYINWAKKVDMKSARPVETEFSRYNKENVTISPGPNGGHNWHPMAYNNTTGLMYIPVQVNSFAYGHDPEWKPRSKGMNIGALTNEKNPTRDDPMSPENMEQGVLLAWDPVKQQPSWSVPNSAFPVNGGVLTTAGDLVFQGTADGRLMAYRAQDGETLWEYNIGSGIIAPPISYEVDGKQYISVAVGWGGGIPSLWAKATKTLKPGAVYTFSLGSDEPLPEKNIKAPGLTQLTFLATPGELEQGRLLYSEYCLTCHGFMGMNGGSIPNLAYSSEAVFDMIEDIVLEGAFLEKGMPNFSDRISAEEVQLIKNYILYSASQMSK
ncbi:MAG: PQQ-dependent dehydrogenase, methanol/ethanol family [Flavobacteriaceae bacterium]